MCHYPWVETVNKWSQIKKPLYLYLVPFWYIIVFCLFLPQKSPVTHERKHTEFVWSETPLSSLVLYSVENMLSPYLLRWLFTSLLHTTRVTHSVANESLEWRTLDRVLTADSGHDPWCEVFSWFSWWVRRSQFLPFLSWERASLHKSRPSILENVIHIADEPEALSSPIHACHACVVVLLELN